MLSCKGRVFVVIILREAKFGWHLPTGFRGFRNQSYTNRTPPNSIRLDTLNAFADDAIPAFYHII